MRCFVLSIILACCFSSCKRGCTDYFASNYNPEAKREDGTCLYLGCTDENALNHEASAEHDDGSCEYPSDVYFYNRRDVRTGTVLEVYWEGDYIGGFFYASEGDIQYCEQTGEAIDVLQVNPGTYSYEVFEKAGGPAGSQTNGASILAGTIQLGTDQCEYIVIKD